MDTTNKKRENKKRDTNENQFQIRRIELNLLHDAESGRETRKMPCDGVSDLLDWKKDTFRKMLKSFIGFINIQLSFLFLWSFFFQLFCFLVQQ